MDEQEISVNIDNNIQKVSIEEQTSDVDKEETLEIINVEEEPPINIETDYAFEALGEQNEQLNHSLLNGRESADQHPIEAITGLKSKLDDIESLKHIYSDGTNLAQYHLWHDGNPDDENRVGYFVSLAKGTDHIQKGGDDIFGVTVSTAGFIGGQNKPACDNTYGLVAIVGSVKVRRESDVVAGDYIIPNLSGYAKRITINRQQAIENIDKTIAEIDSQLESIGNRIQALKDKDSLTSTEEELLQVLENNQTVLTEKRVELVRQKEETSKVYGYPVTSIEDDNGTLYATINLVPQIAVLNDFQKDMINMDKRLTSDEYNITVSISRANQAYEFAVNNADIGQKVDNAIDKANSAVDSVQGAIDAADRASEAATKAMSAVTNAEEVNAALQASIKNAQDNANNAVESINNLKDVLTPITTWVDPISANTGAEYFVDYINNGLATKTEISTVETLVDEAQTAITKNAREINSLVSSTTKYSVGQYSQTYGLSATEASNMIPDGVVYVPTETHQETIVVSEESSVAINFYAWHSYTWNGTEWVKDSEGENVISNGSEVPSGTDISTYWYSGNGVDPIVSNEIEYPSQTLYRWMNGINTVKPEWVAVAILDDNTLSRAISLIQQTDREIRLQVSDATSAASIVAAVNEAGSEVSISADKINFTGKIFDLATDNISLSANSMLLNNKGLTFGTGPYSGIRNHDKFIGTSLVESDSTSYVVFYAGMPQNTYTLNTSPLNISNRIGSGTVNFYILEDGSLYANAAKISGEINATSGTIGGFIIGDGISYNKTNSSGIIVNMLLDAEKLTYYTPSSETHTIVEAGKVQSYNGSFDRLVSPKNSIIQIGESCKVSYSSTQTFFKYYNSNMSASDYHCEIGFLNNEFYIDWINSSGDYLSGNEFGFGKEYTYFKSSSGHLEGTWYGTSSVSITSDQNKKNSIVTMEDSYDIFFDALSPIKYKYNDGTSDRFHIGYIAQSVDSALETAGLTTQDFAGLVIDNNEETGEQDWYLRYGEFVALNTWQIQKLKARVTELEHIITDLKEKIYETDGN